MRKIILAVIALSLILAACAKTTDAPKQLSLSEALAKIPTPAGLGPLGFPTIGAGKAVVAFDPATEPICASLDFFDTFGNGGLDWINAVFYSELLAKLKTMGDSVLGTTVNSSLTFGSNTFPLSCSFMALSGGYRINASFSTPIYADPMSICLKISVNNGDMTCDGFMRISNPPDSGRGAYIAYHYSNADGSYRMLTTPFNTYDPGTIPATADESYVANLMDGTSARYMYAFVKETGVISSVNYGYANASGSCFVYTDGSAEAQRTYGDAQGSVFFFGDVIKDEYRLSGMSAYPPNIRYVYDGSSPTVFIGDTQASGIAILEGKTRLYEELVMEPAGYLNYTEQFRAPFISVDRGASLPTYAGTQFVFKQSLLDAKAALDVKLSGFVLPIATVQKTSYDDSSLLAFINEARAYSYPTVTP
jgi:hypothetical protein